MECYKAYKDGRGGDTNVSGTQLLYIQIWARYLILIFYSIQKPADNWYKGELGFFDFYIIPLAKKLKECGVFGVSSDEYLNYAQKNRQEVCELLAIGIILLYLNEN